MNRVVAEAMSIRNSILFVYILFHTLFDRILYSILTISAVVSGATGLILIKLEHDVASGKHDAVANYYSRAPVREGRCRTNRNG